MKVLYILLGLLLTITFASAHYGNGANNGEIHHKTKEPHHSNHYPVECGPNSCSFGEICHIVHDECVCLPHPHPHPRPPKPTNSPQPTITPVESLVYLTSKVIGRWQDGSRGNKWFTQYDIIIHNDSNRNIKQIYISTDSTFKLRDNSDASLWNMERTWNGVLQLPDYQNSINAHASYTFGFILEGVIPANLNILKIVYE